jgi:hypothetical protein
MLSLKITFFVKLYENKKTRKIVGQKTETTLCVLVIVSLRRHQYTITIVGGFFIYTKFKINDNIQKAILGGFRFKIRSPSFH